MSDITLVATEIEAPVQTPPPDQLNTDLTVARYIELAKQYLYTGSHEIRSKLSAALSTGDTTIQLAYAVNAAKPGIRISCELEDIHVWDVGTDRKSVTVERGQYGTFAASHANGTMVYFSPKFSDAEILREINNEIRDLPKQGIYEVNTLELATSPVLLGYNLPGFAENFEILEVRVRQIGPTDDWYVAQNWDLDRHAPLADFPSGFSLNMREPVPVPSTLHIDYSSHFAPLANLAQLVVDSGMDTDILDIPLLGAAIRLTAGREIKRNFDEWQGEPRRANEIPPGANNAAARSLMLLYQRRVRDEAQHLTARYPTRHKRIWTSW